MDDVRRRNVGTWLALFINTNKNQYTKAKALATANGAFKQTCTHKIVCTQLIPHTNCTSLQFEHFIIKKKNNHRL